MVRYDLIVPNNKRKDRDTLDKQPVWKPPVPLRSEKAALRDFPINALPPIIKEMSTAISVTTSTDVAMASTALLSAASYCFTGVYRMTGKRDHTEPLVLNSLTVAEPSFKKSPVIALVKQPYKQFVKDWNAANKSRIFKCQADRKLLESELDGLEKKKDVTADDIAELQTKISNLPTDDFRRIVVDDITPEALVNQLRINGSLLMISDEAGMLENFGGRYSNSTPNLDLMLKSWNGETYISDRATRGSIILDRPYLSICLACQPYIFDNIIGNPAFRGSGLVARFVYCFPKSNIGHRRYDTEPIPEVVSKEYHRLIYKLLDRKFGYQKDTEILLRFDEIAFKKFVDYYNDVIEKQLVTDMSFCRDWGGKYHGLILRLCGILHCIKCEMDDIPAENVTVDSETLTEAIAIGEYFREQAVYAYGLSEIDISTVKAEHTLAKIKSKGVRIIRQNDLYKLCRCKYFRNAQEFDETMSLLEEYRYVLRQTYHGKNGNNKSGTMVFINTHIYNS